MKVRFGQTLTRQVVKEPTFPSPLSDDVAGEALKERRIGRSFAPTLGSLWRGSCRTAFGI